MMKNSQPIIQFDSQEDWEAWLKKNHATSDGIWIKLTKKGSKIKSVSRQEVLDTAICYGWIDGQTASVDDDFWLQRFTRRGPKSKWSKINCKKATDLIAQGKMKAAGFKEIELAKEDGRWDRAYDSQRTMAVPDDFRKKLDENQQASEFFDNLDSKNRYAILYRIHDAKKSETRARRIEKFVSMLNDGKKIH